MNEAEITLMNTLGKRVKEAVFPGPVLPPPETTGHRRPGGSVLAKLPEHGPSTKGKL